MHVSDPIEWEATLPGVRPSSPAWRATIRALYGSPLSESERALYNELSGGIDPPAVGAREALICGGRRSGKSESAARVAVYEAVHGGHGVALARGQRAVIAIVAAERKIGKEILNYCKGLCESPAVKRQVIEVLGESIRFKGGIDIRIFTADSVSVRGATIVCAILDEVAFWPHEPSADSDIAIVEALRPAMAPIKNAPPRKLIAISSAGVRDGWFYDQINEHRGNPTSRTIAVLGTTLQFNPNADLAWLAAQRHANERKYQNEYESVFSDVITDGWFGQTNIDRGVDKGRTSTPYVEGLRYFIAVDTATISDQWAVCVACSMWRYQPDGTKRRHTEIVYSRAWQPKPNQPLDIRQMIFQTRRVCEAYGTARVYIDNFASAPLRELFRDAGIRAEVVNWSGNGATNKHARFSAFRDGLVDGSLRLPDDPQLLSELANIRGTALPSGGERLEASIGHDDRAAAAVMAASLAMAAPPGWPAHGAGREHWYEREARERAWRRVALTAYGLG